MELPRHLIAAAALVCLWSACSSRGGPSAPTAPVPKDWPNEPSGMTVVTDWGFDQTPPVDGDLPIPNGGGWNIVSELASESAPGWVEEASDPRAPFSPAAVYDFVYP